MLKIMLMTVSAGIVLLLGTLHLLYTFSGPKLLPRDPELQAAMSRVSPVISRQTTMWRAWIGFNASHSMGAMLFGLIYGYLALFHADLLFRSVFLLGVGLAMLMGFVALGKAYWFSIPFAGVTLSLMCYVSSIVAARAT